MAWLCCSPTQLCRPWVAFRWTFSSEHFWELNLSIDFSFIRKVCVSPEIFFSHCLLNLNSIANQCHSHWDPCVPGLAALSPSDGSAGVYEDLKWIAVLCCELPFAQTLDDGLSEHPPVGQCQLLNATKPEFSSKSPTLSGKINLCDITIIAFGMTFSKWRKIM